MKKVVNAVKKHWREYTIFISCSVTFAILAGIEFFTKETIPAWLFSVMVSILSFLLFISFAITSDILESMQVSYKKFSTELYEIHLKFMENMDNSFRTVKVSENKLSEKDNG